MKQTSEELISSDSKLIIKSTLQLGINLKRMVSVRLSFSLEVFRKVRKIFVWYVTSYYLNLAIFGHTYQHSNIYVYSESALIVWSQHLLFENIWQYNWKNDDKFSHKNSQKNKAINVICLKYSKRYKFSGGNTNNLITTG